ncbi:lysophospholipase [Flavobacterium sp. CHNK8]|uniref:alpha/beta hydrolase n=1 Tax=Flavobacterium sp. CHNK8 TaxID=2871165 RepID=UPI001C8CFFEC|nr:alpha/beta hydrolase [Flavobacterium sp. CHNK8]QZK89679.1 lysophospholipase [Flavobacterium sp. CHNK8]
MKIIYTFVFITLTAWCHAQNKNFTTKEVAINPLLKGTLYAPNESSKKKTLVIVIAGSGPTDRDGNQRNLVNNSLKFLCEGIASRDIHAFSYDKRMFAMAQAGTLNEASLSFEDFITDAKEVVQFFKNQKIYKKIVVIGHSEGALIGLVAASQNTDAYISIAGAGRGIDAVLLEQIALQAPSLKDEVKQNLEILKTGKTFELKNQMLASIFRPSVQPYMISWLKYQPQEEIKKLQIPILIINGTKDLQVSVADAQLLQQAKPTAKLVIINNMTHVFKDISGDDSANKASYNNPELPNSSQLLDEIISFIKNLNM